MSQTGKRSSWLGGAVAFLAVVGLAWWQLQPHELAKPPAQSVAPAMAGQAQAGREQASGTSIAPTESQEEISSNANGIELLGTVQADRQATLSVRQPARITAGLVREGQRVQRGQPLILLDSRESDAQALTARAGVLAAQAQLARAQAGRNAQKVKADSDVTMAQSGLTQAKATWRKALLARDAAATESRADVEAAQESVRKATVARDRARETLVGLEELSKVGGVSRSDLEGARAQLTVAESDFATAQQGVQRAQAGPNAQSNYRVVLAQQDVDAAQAGVQQAQSGLQTALRARRESLAVADQEIQAARAGVEQAQAGVSGALLGAEQARLVSPLDGVAINLTARAGETAQPGTPLVSVIDPSALHIEALVPARQIGLVRVGQAANVRVDTTPAKNVSALVSEVSPVAEPGGRAFRLRLRLRTASSGLRAGQNVRIGLGKAGT